MINYDSVISGFMLTSKEIARGWGAEKVNLDRCLDYRGDLASKQDIIRQALSCKGWTDENRLSLLFDLVRKTECLPGDILEIGSALGRSTVLLGLASSKIIWSIDPHTGGLAYINKGEDQNSYEEFLGNIARFGIAHRINVLKFATREVNEQMLIPADHNFSLIFIDGLHTAEGVRVDFELAYPRLEHLGIMVFDDYYQPTVKDYSLMIDELARKYSIELVDHQSSGLIYFVNG